MLPKTAALLFIFLQAFGRQPYTQKISIYYGLNCPPTKKKKRYIDILTSSALERDLIWKKSIFRFDQVRMRSQGWA